MKRLYRMKVPQVDFLCWGRTLMEFYSIKDRTRTTAQIPVLFCWRWLGSVVATQLYKVYFYDVKAHEVDVLCRGSTQTEFVSIAEYSTTPIQIRFSVFWSLLGPVLAIQWYKICGYYKGNQGAKLLAISNTQWLVPPQPLEQFQFGFCEVIGLDASYKPV